MPNTLFIEVVYALSTQQFIERIELPEGATLLDAVKASSFSKKFPELAQSPAHVGIFGKVCPIDQVLNNADRVEIYRPLIHDPKEARRQRAKK